MWRLAFPREEPRSLLSELLMTILDLVLSFADTLVRYAAMAVTTMAAWLAISPIAVVVGIVGIAGIVVLAVVVGLLLKISVVVPLSQEGRGPTAFFSIA